MNYWTALASEQGRNIALSSVAPTVANCPSEAILVEYLTSAEMAHPQAFAEAVGTADGRSGEIRMNKDTLPSNFSDWADMGAHEFGHLFDFANVDTPGCSTLSIMAWDGQHGLGQINQCADRTAITTRYHGNNHYQDNYSDPLGGDCYQWLVVTFWEYFDGENWNYAGFTIDADYGSYCGPPPY
jgi:hypothetical protein